MSHSNDELDRLMAARSRALLDFALHREAVQRRRGARPAGDSPGAKGPVPLLSWLRARFSLQLR